MVSELLTNMTGAVGVFYGIGAVNALYLFMFMFAVMFGVVAISITKKPFVGLASMLGFLFIASIMDAFPLWVLAFPIAIIIMLGAYFKGSE